MSSEKTEKTGELSFEEAAARAEELAAKLENGALSLEDSLKAYEEGTKMVRLCEKKLETARLRVENLAKSEE